MRGRLKLVCALAIVPSAALAGAVEVLLDRAAVTALLASQLPNAVELRVPLLGPLTVRLQPAAAVAFVDGGIETRVAVQIEPLDARADLELRVIPEVEPLQGTVQFRVRRALLTGRFAAIPDLSALFAPIELPRMFDWEGVVGAGKATHVELLVQGVAVEKERVAIRLGLRLKPLPPTSR